MQNYKKANLAVREFIRVIHTRIVLLLNIQIFGSGFLLTVTGIVNVKFLKCNGHIGS